MITQKKEGVTAYENLLAIHAQAEFDGHGSVEVGMMDLSDLLAEFGRLRAAALKVKNAKAKKAETPAAGAGDLPAWLPADAWQAFLEMRKKIKKPATDYAQKLLIKKLAAFYANDLDPSVILNQSTLNGWQDLYAPKEQSTARMGRFGGVPAAEQNRANNAEALRLLGQPSFYPDDGLTIEAAQ